MNEPIRVICEFDSTFTSIVVPSITVIISLLAIFISWWSLITNGRKNKNDTLLTIKTLIDSARDNVIKTTAIVSNMNESSDQKMKDVRSALIDESKERILNAYNLACERFFSGAVEKKDFENNFSSDIRQYMEDDDYKSYFTEPFTKFGFMNKFYKERLKD